MRHAYSLIEVLAVLAILIVTAGSAGMLGHEWLWNQKEEAFYRTVLARWNRGVELTELTRKPMKLSVRNDTLYFSIANKETQLELPEGLTVYHPVDGSFTKSPGFRNNGASKLILRDHRQRLRIFTINMGWGMMRLDETFR